MEVNRQLYIAKFDSSRLKKFDYNINATYEELLENKEIIGLSDNQFLRSIRDIKGQEINFKTLDELYKKRDILEKKCKTAEDEAEIEKIEKEIDNMTFIEEYIAIKMDHPSHYDYLFDNGLIIDDEKHERLSSSAGQSRKSTVVFCKKDNMLEELNKRLDNGRNKGVKFSPSKFNAYKGTYGSATKGVSTPRFCVVKDYESISKVRVNWVTETDINSDDKIDEREIEEKFNRWDGMGLISPERANKWADELKLDYTPSQWCIRQSFIKGMVCTFDFHDFCEKKNNGNYLIETIYKDENENPIMVDLRDVDVIVTESQFKLWDSYNSVEEYKENCIINKLNWGVSLYTPKVPKDILSMNYQFLQTLKLNKPDIELLCQKFVDWIKGVNSEDIYYTLLFLMGENVTKESVEKYIKNSTNHWVKALIINHKLLDDKYIKQKVYQLIKKRIKKGCLGDIIVDGNYQVLVSDPYAMMQYICGQKITGLLKEGEYYSGYWNKKGVKVVDSMRAPLTFRSEHLKLNLVRNEEMDYWYKYCENTGVIVNVFGHETMNWAGSDWDYDTIATTSDATILKGVYENEMPVVYEAPKPEKILFTEEDLYKSDLFAFGSIIGKITNKSTSGYALLPLLEKGSEEYNVTMNRLKMCTKLQSAQIDKAKIGRDVKGIPESWSKRQRILKTDTQEDVAKKELLNNILLDRHPYFFRYLYDDTNRKYKKHISDYETESMQRYGIKLQNLINKESETLEELETIKNYHMYMPVIESDSVMNVLCKYIESIDFEIRKNINYSKSEDVYELLKIKEIEDDDNIYKAVVKEYKYIMKEIKAIKNIGNSSGMSKEKFNEDKKNKLQCIYKSIRKRIRKVCPNIINATNYLIKMCYVDYTSYNKDILWNIYGDIIVDNIKSKKESETLFPIPHEEGDIEYLNKKYKLQEVDLLF